MRRPVWAFLGLLGIAAAVWVPRLALAQSAGPGSSGDPLVTRSFVEQAIAAAIAHLSPPTFTLLELTPGQVLLMGAGTEAVVRTGNALAVVAPAGGLSDLTAGANLGAAAKVPANHLILVPRADGRGISAQTTVLVLVKGTYTIENAPAGTSSGTTSPGSTTTGSPGTQGSTGTPTGSGSTTAPPG